jgi:hypothetical protein
MNKLPTDISIFECIYKMYGQDFREFSKKSPSRSAKIYVPIDIDLVAEELKTDAHELFGRLYYHLDKKYRYTQDDGSLVHLFAFRVGKDRHCINYPYLAAVLSEHRLDNRRNKWAIGLAILALVISLGSIVAQALTAKLDHVATAVPDKANKSFQADGLQPRT